MPKLVGIHSTPPVARSSAVMVRQRILELLAKTNADSADVALALADILALTAVTLDLEAGRQSLDDRLHSFEQRVRETYVRARRDMKVIPKA